MKYIYLSVIFTNFLIQGCSDEETSGDVTETTTVYEYPDEAYNCDIMDTLSWKYVKESLSNQCFEKYGEYLVQGKYQGEFQSQTLTVSIFPPWLSDSSQIATVNESLSDAEPEIPEPTKGEYPYLQVSVHKDNGENSQKEYIKFYRTASDNSACDDFIYIHEAEHPSFLKPFEGEFSQWLDRVDAKPIGRLLCSAW